MTCTGNNSYLYNIVFIIFFFQYKISISSKSWFQLLEEFFKYEHLLLRPNIREALEPERKALLDRIINCISSFDSNEECKWISCVHVPRAVANLMKAAHDEGKVCSLV